MHFPRLSCSCTCSSEELRGADVLPSLPGAQAKRRRLALTLTRNGGCQVRKPHICRWDAFVYYTRHGMVQHDIIISASKPEEKERPRFQASTKPLNHALQCDQHFARFGKKQLSNATPKQTCRAPAAAAQQTVPSRIACTSPSDLVARATGIILDLFWFSCWIPMASDRI